MDSGDNVFYARRNRAGHFSWVSDPKKARVFKSRDEVVRYLKKYLGEDMKHPCGWYLKPARLYVFISAAIDEDVQEYEKQKQCE